MCIVDWPCVLLLFTGGIAGAGWCRPVRCRRKSATWTPSTSRCPTAGGWGPVYPGSCAARSNSTCGAGPFARFSSSGRTWANGSGRGGCSRATAPRARRRARCRPACTAGPPGTITRRCCGGTAGAPTAAARRPCCSSTTAWRRAPRRPLARWTPSRCASGSRLSTRWSPSAVAVARPTCPNDVINIAFCLRHTNNYITEETECTRNDYLYFSTCSGTGCGRAVYTGDFFFIIILFIYYYHFYYYFFFFYKSDDSLHTTSLNMYETRFYFFRPIRY